MPFVARQLLSLTRYICIEIPKGRTWGHLKFNLACNASVFLGGKGGGGEGDWGVIDFFRIQIGSYVNKKIRAP